MLKTFIETDGFKRSINKLEDLSLLQRVQNEILKNPKAGKLIRGTNGVRKIRISNPTGLKGKSGGFRVIYYELTEKEKIYLISIYDKSKKIDISSDEKKLIYTLVNIFKNEVAS